MKFKKLRLDTYYDYRPNTHPHKRDAIPHKVQLISLESVLKINKLGKLIGFWRAEIEHMDGRREYIDPCRLYRAWETHEKEEHKRTLITTMQGKKLIRPSDDTRAFWGSSECQSVLTENDLTNYSGPDITCANPMEDWIIRLFDKAGIIFVYEPREFKGHRVGFRPDLYIPSLDLYVELSATPQEQGRKKRSKLRMMENDFPNIKATVLFWEDVMYFANNDLDKKELEEYFLDPDRLADFLSFS